MESIMMFLLWALGCTVTLWVFYLAAMALKTANDAGRIPSIIKPLAYALVGVGLFVDFIVNSFVATFLFLELPKELTVTSRVSRHKKESTGWRKTLADWICSNLLDPFDVTGHCK